MLVFQSIYGLGVIIKFVLSIRRAAITRDYWAIQADLNMDFVWFDKGLILLEQKRCKEAIEAFDRAIQLNPIESK